MQINVTPEASAKIVALKQGRPQDQEFRIMVIGGGCSGFQYKLLWDTRREDDIVSQKEGFLVLVDPKSAEFLDGVRIDYQDGLEASGFDIQNPNACHTCGCGKSFS